MARAPKTFRARFELPAELEHYVEPTDDLEGLDDDEPMTDEDLAALVDGQIDDSRLYESVDLTQLRKKALEYFEGDISADVPAAPGSSSVVSKDIADVHGLIMPGLMRVFLATDNIAIYNPVTQADEPFARQATDYVNHVVMKECDGYALFRSSMHDGLLLGNGPIKHWWDDTPQYSTESFSGLPDDAYTMLVMDPDVEIIEHSEYPDPDWMPPPPMPSIGGMGMPGGGPEAMDASPEDMMAGPSPNMDPGVFPEEMPVPQAPSLHDCKLKRMTSKGRLRVMSMAPEDLLLGRGTLSLDEENVRFAAHRWRKTRSALIKEGYDADQINDLPSYTGANLDTPEQLARDRHHLYEGDNSPDKSTELIEGYECYLQCDYDGDGVAEWRKVVMAGTSGKRAVLENEEWGDDLPFSDIVPDPVPHRWRGRSLYDSMEDIQRIKSVLWRQILDNVYRTNNPRQKVILGSVVNPEALADYECGSTIFVTSQDAIVPDVIPFTANNSFPILDGLDQVIEKRTGISRSTMALDMEALSEQTATAVNANQAAAHTKVEEYARNIAEYGGLKRVFSKILKLIVKHQDRARTVRLRDGWVTVDPRAWNAEMDVTINTGLGSGSRERDLTMLAGIATKQEAIIMQLGPTNPVCGIDRLLETYRKMVEAAGLKPADRFFPEVQPQVMQQMQQAAAQKVDPKLQIAQVQAQVDGQKMQMQAQIDQQAEQTRAQVEVQKMQLKAAADQQQARLKAQVDAQMLRFEQQMEVAKAQRDAQLQQIQLERQAQVEERQAQADMATKQQETQSKAQLAHLQADFQARLAQQQFAHEQALAREKFEFDKRIKLLDAWAKQRAAAAKPTAEGQPATPEAPDIDFESMLAKGAGLPEAQHSAMPALQQIVQTLEQLAQSHGAHANELAVIREEIAKPKRKRVIRDENNRVIGAEEY